MATSYLAIAQPPTDMPTPDTTQTTATVIIGTVVALMLVGALFLWKRTGNPAGMLVLIGGFVCSFNEELVDVLGHCYFPEDSWVVHEYFDRGIPLWVVLAYVGFFGGLTYLSVLALQRGATYKSMWLALGGLWVINLILELPILASDLYVYYGDQPFEVGGFPLSWLVINSLGSLFAALVIHRLSWFFTGPRQLLLLVVPFATYMSSWVPAMPHFAATNSDASSPVRWIAAAVSMGLGLLAIDFLIRVGVGKWQPAARAAAPAASTLYTRPRRPASAGSPDARRTISSPSR